jgi:hypothetical protein
MESVPTGITLTWLIMAAIGTSPLLYSSSFKLLGRSRGAKGPERVTRKWPDPG